MIWLVVIGTLLAISILGIAVKKESLLLTIFAALLLLGCVVGICFIESESSSSGVYCPECGAVYRYCPVDGSELIIPCKEDIQ